MQAEQPARAPNSFSANDIRRILIARGWAGSDLTAEHQTWIARAASLLGPQADSAEELESLLQAVFEYDARAVLDQVDAHAVLSRQSARNVVRALGNLLLDGAPLTSDRFKEIAGGLKEQLDLRSRDLFHPLRLALTGRAAGGELDRVILVLDEAAALAWRVPVKSARARVVEFCASLD